MNAITVEPGTSGRAGECLAQADRNWLGRLISRREPPARFDRARARQPDGIKAVVQFQDI